MKITINPNRNGSFKIDIRKQFTDIDETINAIIKECEKHNIVYLNDLNIFYNDKLNKIYFVSLETLKYNLKAGYIIPFKSHEISFYNENAINEIYKRFDRYLLLNRDLFIYDINLKYRRGLIKVNNQIYEYETIKDNPDGLKRRAKIGGLYYHF